MTAHESLRQSASGRRQTYPGRQLAVLLLGLLVLAIGLPAIVASTVNAVRVGQAQRAAEALAAFVAREGDLWTASDPGAAGGTAAASRPACLAGPGELPRLPDSWNEQRIDTLAAILGPARLRRLEMDRVAVADPWQNAYLVIWTSQPAESAWVVSAGPNGVVESNPDAPGAGGGDDIVVDTRPIPGRR